ncbi:MAG: IclR family transcriptional regulator [Bacillota bacterium]|jgi:DNA-binding IclR family transcriptional regulator
MKSDTEVKTLANALKLLDLFIVPGGENRGWRIKDLAAETSVSELTVLRTLNTLVKHGYLEYRESSSLYSLSPKWLRASAVFRIHSTLRQVAIPHLAQLAGQYDACASVGIRFSEDVLLLDRVMKPALHAIFSPSGSRAAWHSTAIGKVVAAYSPVEDLENYLKHAILRPYTEKTISDPDVLRAHLSEVRARGYATDICENAEGIYCIAAPIFERGKEVMAAISLAAPSDSLVREPALKGVVESLTRVSACVAGLLW